MPYVRIGGVDFNAANSLYTLDDFEGWWDTPTPRAVILPNGGGYGSVAGGQWESAEAYKTLTGTVILPYTQQDAVRRALLLALPTTQDVPIAYYGEGWEDDKQAFVRRYDKATFNRDLAYMEFSIPLVMLDPHKYGLQAVEGSCGAYSGERFARFYEEDPPNVWVRKYDLGNDSRIYIRQGTLSGMPAAVSLVSEGDVVSRRVTASVTGPLERGGWWLINETTGEKIYARTGLLDGQAINFDTARRRAWIGGTDVTDKVYGDWPTLTPGSNVFHLISSTPSVAYATISALEAYL